MNMRENFAIERIAFGGKRPFCVDRNSSPVLRRDECERVIPVAGTTRAIARCGWKQLHCEARVLIRYGLQARIDYVELARLVRTSNYLPDSLQGWQFVNCRVAGGLE